MKMQQIQPQKPTVTEVPKFMEPKVLMDCLTVQLKSHVY